MSAGKCKDATTGMTMNTISRTTRVIVIWAVALVASLTLAPAAVAVFGDEYGIAPINGHPDAIQSAPAFETAPGVDSEYAFWAGACDRSADPGAGQPLGGIGNGTGEGTRLPEVLAGANQFPKLPAPSSPAILGQVPMPASPLAEHCLDLGASTMYDLRILQQGKLWQTFPYTTGQPHVAGGIVGQEIPGCTLTTPLPLPDSCNWVPKWRQPALTLAGGHPDGSTSMVWNRNEEGVGTSVGSIEGSVDNIRVELPPGFVGNPQAVPFCTNEQFRAKPLRCPSRSQVGILRLNLEGLGIGVPQNLPGNQDTSYPVYNLEPREGKLAELGIAYAGYQAAIRLVAEARTNGDYGVTAFVGQVPAALVLLSQEITLWGVPWDEENDIWRTAFPALDEAPSDCQTQPGTGSSAINTEYLPPSGLPFEHCISRWDSSWGEITPFLTNETDCNPAPTVRLATDSFQNPGKFTAEDDPELPPAPELLTGAAAAESGWKTYGSTSPATSGCADLDFQPDLDLQPSSQAADGATGLTARLAIPQNNSPRDGDGNVLDPDTPNYRDLASDYWNSDAGRASAHLKDTVVTLPAGVSLNPSAATGLKACSDVGIGLRPGTDAYSGRRLFNDGDPFNGDQGADGSECPAESKVGTALVNTPLLEAPLEGELVLGEPKSTDPQSGEMFRLFIVVRDSHRGLVAKIYGTSKADGVVGEGGTGQLTTTFEANPEVPFDDLTLDIKGGDKGLLALPQSCGTPAWTSSFTPWSAVGAPVPVASPTPGNQFTVDQRCDETFRPALDAGLSNQDARGSGAFVLRITRPAGDRNVAGVSVQMPKGLLASVRGVPLCSAAAGDAGSCGEGSRIGSVDGAAGSGTPFVLERKGSVYLTGGYKGAPYGLSIVVPVEAGPFRGATALKTIVVRAAVQVDRQTAQVTVVTDPLPQVWHGIPLRVREIITSIDRPNFMVNPSDCTAKQVVADLTSAQGATASPASPFEATNCARLGFKPKLSLKLTGRRQMVTNKHPGVRARVTQTSTEAGIERAEVRLPKSLALDPDNAQALCEFTDGTKPDLEKHCPKGSIVGRATAISPLLNRPLAGNVYFVKNVRIDPRTGNPIRTLPMIIAALRGEIAINLRGESDVKGKNQNLVSTFASVPDAPVSRFNLNIKGGDNGILAVTRTRRNPKLNLCSLRQVAVSKMDAHNARDYDRRIRMTTPCKPAKRNAVCRTKAQKQTKACKRQQARRNRR